MSFTLNSRGGTCSVSCINSDTEKLASHCHSRLSYLLYYDKTCVPQQNKTCHSQYQSPLIGTILLRAESHLRSWVKRGEGVVVPPPLVFLVCVLASLPLGEEIFELKAAGMAPWSAISGTSCLGFVTLHVPSPCCGR